MDQVIWKYCDFWKFKSLIEKGFHFRRADKLVDPFEGHFAWGSGVNKYMDERLKERNAQPNPMPGYSYLLVKLQEYERKKRSVYISCWQNDRYESEAMWNLYTGVKEDANCKAIVLKSSIDKLEKTVKPLIKPYKLKVKSVEYLENYGSEDYQDTSNSIFFKKRKCFSYEKEVRAVFGYKRFTGEHENDENMFFKFDASELIEEVRISPFLGPEFIHEVKGLLESNGFDIPVNPSEIEMQPEVGIDEILEKVENVNQKLGDRVIKTIRPLGIDKVEIVESFDDIRKTYKVSLKKK